MENQQQRVRQFMEFFGQECPNKPKQLDFETAKLRANLILEEVFETITKGLGLKIFIWNGNKMDQDGEGQHIEIEECDIKSIGFKYEKSKDVDLVELMDGLSDLHYVGYCGTSVAAGIDAEPCFTAIHESNLTKAWNKEELEEAKLKYPDAKIEKYSENLYRLIRGDGKIIKSPNYKPANLASIIQSQIDNPSNRRPDGTVIR